MTVWRVADDRDLAAVRTGPGDVVLLRGGVVFNASALPASLLDPSNVTLGSYGSGRRPRLSGGVFETRWTHDPVHDVYSRPAARHNSLGNVCEDGVPMRFAQWNRDLATTAAGMARGARRPYWAGAMTYDPATRIVYIRPSEGVPSDHEYIVSDGGTVDGHGILSMRSARGLTIHGIELCHFGGHGIVLLNKRDAYISDCLFRVCGGNARHADWLGNGLELSAGCDGAQVVECEAEDMFDAGFTSQLYESRAQQLGAHRYAGIRVTRFGMSALEISAQSRGQTVRDIEIDGFTALDGGRDSWAGDRNGAALTVLSQFPNDSIVTRVFARNLQARNTKRLYLGYQHGGICGIEDSFATATWGQAPRSEGNGAVGHVDLWRNVSDSLGPLAGGQWRRAETPIAAFAAAAPTAGDRVP